MVTADVATGNIQSVYKRTKLKIPLHADMALGGHFPWVVILSSVSVPVLNLMEIAIICLQSTSSYHQFIKNHTPR